MVTEGAGKICCPLDDIRDPSGGIAPDAVGYTIPPMIFFCPIYATVDSQATNSSMVIYF